MYIGDRDGMEKGRINIKTVVGFAAAVLSLCVALYGLCYVGSLCSQNLFAIPLFFAVIFAAISLPLAIVGIIVSALARKKQKKAPMPLAGLVSGLISLVLIAVFVIMGVNTLSFNDFTSFQNAYLYDEGEYSEQVSELFESLHGDDWVF